MSLRVRVLKDKIFSSVATLSILLLVITLIIVLTPIIFRGSRAVFFHGTVEFRRLQFDKHDRGDEDEILAEVERFNQQKAEIFNIIDEFSQGIDTSSTLSLIREIFRDYSSQLRHQGVEQQEYLQMRSNARDIRNLLADALETDDEQIAYEKLQQVSDSYDPAFESTEFAAIFEIAQRYKQTLDIVDLTQRDLYAQELSTLISLFRQLLGPDPNRRLPVLIMEQYGATRRDYADRLLEQIIYKDVWVVQAGSESLVRTKQKRSEIFANTPLEPLLDSLPEKVEQMLAPKPTFYWQFFIDDSTPGRFFGGVGPEILGTLSLTILAVLISVPLGIISAAYLAECANDNMLIRIIRMSINTLAGVPSIVFGLFGMAFFVLYLLPLFGQSPRACILTASMTLSILILPVIIRASEEAIKAVPDTYKQASLALGAGKFKTFMKVTLPAAMPGILTGIILSLSRAAGETAPILFTGAVALGPVPTSIMQPTRALSYGAYDMAVGDRIAMLVPHQQYGMVATLVLLVLLLNMTAIFIRSRVSAKLRGS